MAYDSGLTPSDVALLSGNNGNNSGFGGWGDSAWIIIFLIFALGGWNGNGWGSNGRSSDGINPNYVTSSDSAFLSRQIDSDTAGIERKLDYVQEQICTSDSMRSNQVAGINENLFTLQNNMGVQFAGVNQGISNNRYETQLAVGNAQTGLQNSITALSAQQAQCCCDNKILAMQNANALQSQLATMNYDNAMATNGLQNSLNSNFCTTNYNNQANTRDIIDAINASARATQDMIFANRLEDKNAQISELQTALNNANLRASQARQTNEIVDALRVPTPVPSFNVPTPWSYNGCNNGGCNGTF